MREFKHLNKFQHKKFIYDIIRFKFLITAKSYSNIIQIYLILFRKSRHFYYHQKKTSPLNYMFKFCGLIRFCTTAKETENFALFFIIFFGKVIKYSSHKHKSHKRKLKKREEFLLNIFPPSF